MKMVENMDKTISIAKSIGVEPINWFEFVSFIGNEWFQGKFTWNQKEVMCRMAYEIKEKDSANWFFGAIRYAIKTNQFCF